MKINICGATVGRSFSMVVLALMVVACPAFAQKADRPTVKVGDQWQFRTYTGVTPLDSHNWVVESVVPTGIKATEDGQPLELSSDLNNIDSPRGKNSDLRLLNFPLEVGKQWSYVNDYVMKDLGRETGRSNVDVAVVGYEKVRIPAGEFDAFKLEARGSYSGSAGAGKETRTYWYAPAARAIVKEEFQRPYPIINQLEWFQLQP